MSGDLMWSIVKGNNWAYAHEFILHQIWLDQLAR
jgi:hypothetical protein